MESAQKQAARDFFRALETNDQETLARVLDRDLVAKTIGTSQICGIRTFEEFTSAVPRLQDVTDSNGIRFEVEHLTEEDNRVSCTVSGHSTLFNGKPYNNHYHLLFFFRDGKIVSLLEYFDTLLAENTLVAAHADQG